MGHGWKTTRKSEISRKPCDCGKGFIVEYEEEKESDYPPFERTRRKNENECPNKCHLKKK